MKKEQIQQTFKTNRFSTSRERFIASMLQEAKLPVTKRMVKALTALYSVKETGVMPGVPLASEAQDCRRDLGEYAGALLDKNGSAATYTCPRLWWKFYRDEIWRSTEYEHTHMKRSDALRSYKQAYDDHDWKGVAPYHKEGTLPYMYMFRKEKDMDNKSRKICSTVDHPLKLVSKYFTLGLYTVVKADHRTGTKFMNLMSTFQALPAFKRDYHEMKAKQTGMSKYLCYAGDIENMYNELDQEVILRSVACMLWKTSRKSRHNYHDCVSIFKSDKQANRVGRSYVEGTLQLTFKQIFQFVKYDIENSLFVLGNHVLRFARGVPQGNKGSPLYAFCFCIYQEDMFFASVYDGKLLRDGTYQFSNRNNVPASSNKRYFDDCRIVVQYERKNKASKQAAKDYISRYAKQCYHESVKIIPEPAGDGFKFLQGTFTFNPKFSARYEGKNWQHWLETGQLKVRLIQHYHSYCESYRNQRFATLVGKLHEIQNFSCPLENTWGGLLSIMPDLVFAEYPINVIVGAMKRMATKTGYAGWVTNIQQAKLAYRMVQTQSNRPSTQSNSE
jgi:hypothetical protein